MKTFLHLFSSRKGICFGIAANALMLGAALSPVKAIMPGIDNLSGGLTGANNSWTLGYKFNIDKNKTIDALGSYDNDGDGLNGTYTIGLWDNIGTLLSTATVSGNGDPLVSGFRWASITDITLSPGDYIVASAGDWALNGDFYFYSGNYTTNDLTYISDQYIQGGSLQFPTNSAGVAPGFFGGNISFKPVPAPLPLFGIGAAYGFSRQLRRRIKTASQS